MPNPPKVEQLMSGRVVTVELASSAFDAASKILNHDIGCVVVTGEKGKVEGLITKGDVLREVVMKKLDPQRVGSESIMSRPVVTVGPKTTLAEAQEIMTKNNLTKLPVIDSGELVGIITSTDILRGSRPRKMRAKDAI
jgi:CBS domain-containing protein